MEKTIKYLENGEYHYATVRSVGDLAKLKTNSKETLVEAINELWNGGGSGGNPDVAPKPEGYDQLVQDVADAVSGVNQVNQAWVEWKKADEAIEAEKKQEYLKAMREMQEAIEKAKQDAAELSKKTDELDDKITKTFSDLDTNISNMHKQLEAENDLLSKSLDTTKTELESTKKDLQNVQLDNGKVHDDIVDLQGKFDRKIWNTDLDPLKEQINQNSTEVKQTKNELLEKADRSSLDTLTGTVENLDTQVKKTANGVEMSVKKSELGGEIAEAIANKTNLLLGTRRFTTNNWTQLDNVTFLDNPWKGFRIAEQKSPNEGILQSLQVKAGTNYIFSAYVKVAAIDDNLKPKMLLAKNLLDTSLDTKIDVWKKDIDVTTDFQRYQMNFMPSEDCEIFPHIVSTSNNHIFVGGFQVEIGKDITPWEPNQEDVGNYVEKSESQFNVYNDKIQSLTEKQRQQGDTQEQLRTQVTQTAEGTKQVSEQLKSTNGDITKLRGQIEASSKQLKSEYEEYTNKAVGQISDSTLNLIKNSSFMNRDDDFSQWQNISAKANIREDENGLRWVELTQSGQTTDNPQGITSNYFKVKQGKVTIAVDIKSGINANLDNQSVLFLELYSSDKKRVDFEYVSLEQLGLSINLLNDHQVHRGLYRKGIDRQDVSFMTVKAHLIRNGDLLFTNFSARLSSIDDGAYEPNPDDVNQQILKQNTKIEQNAKEVAIKANSVDVTRDIKSAVDNVQVGSKNLIQNSNASVDGATPWPHTHFQNHAFYYNGTKKMFNLNTSAKTELTSESNWFPVEAGQQYTLSFKGFMSWNVSSYDVWLLGKKAGSEGGWTSSYQLIGGNTLSNGRTESVEKTFIAPASWNDYEAYIRFDNNGSKDGADSVFFFNEVKLEKGNKATDWTPAPEDTSAKIKSAKDAAIKVASDQVNIHVNELKTSFDDKLNQRTNEIKTAYEKFTSDGIEQTVHKITDVKTDVDRLGDKVDGIQIGTQNLVPHSDTFEYWHKGIYASISTNKYLNGNIVNLYPNKGDGAGGINATLDGQHNQDTITWTVYAKADNAGDKLHTELWGGGGITDQPLTTEWKIYRFSGKQAKNNYDLYFWGISGNKGNVYVALPYAVIGNTIGTWLPNPEDTQQQITNTNKKIDTQTLDSANIDQMKTQGHYFVHNLTGNPLSGWVYVDVTGNNNDRVRQDVYQDSGNIHAYRRWYGSGWSTWDKSASQNDIASLKTETTASIKNLGDRVTTEVNSVTSRINNIKIGGRNLVKMSSFHNVSIADLQKSGWYINNGIWINKTGGRGQTGSIVLDYRNGTQGVLDMTQTIQLEPDTDYTLSLHLLYAELAAGKPFNAWTYLVEHDASGRNVSPYVDNGHPMANSDDRNQNTRIIHTTKNTHSGILYLRANPGTKIELEEVKLEKGNKVTDWSPAPEDIQDEIKTLNTKWDVANGQIQGKVTETQVHNILNNGGYATRSWAQSQFRMKSDSIDFEVKKITDPIQNQINSNNSSLSNRINETNNRLNDIKIGGTNLIQNGNASVQGATPWENTKTYGHVFYHNGTKSMFVIENSSSNELTSTSNFFPVEAGQKYTLSFKGFMSSNVSSYDVWLLGKKAPANGSWDHSYQIIGGQRLSPSRTESVVITFTIPNDWNDFEAQIRFDNNGSTDGGNSVFFFNEVKLEKGTKATDWSSAPEEEVNTRNVISKINISPEKIRLLSSKIEIDGNTKIHGTLEVPEVKLQGKSGFVDLSGDGINIAKTNGAGMNIAGNAIEITANTNGQKEVEGVITPAWSLNNKNQNGIGLILTTEQDLGRPYGGDILTIGTMPTSGKIHAAMIFDATGISDYNKGFNWFAPHTLSASGGIFRFPGAQDDLLMAGVKIPGSPQEGYFQPAMRLVHGNSQGTAGLQFEWDDLVPFGRINSSESYFRATGGSGGITVSWYSFGNWYSGMKAPAIVHRDENGNMGNGGLVFYPGGEVCFWQGDWRTNLRWSGLNSTN